MTKLKGRKTLNKKITKILSNFSVTSAELGKEYCYYFDEDKINFSLVITEEDKLYNDFVKEKFDYTITNIFIFSLLHELGHKFNNDEICGTIYHYCLHEKDRIAEKLFKEDKKKRLKELHYQYFSLPDEIAATAWAVDYAKTHKKELNKMWKKMEKAIHKFYSKNNLEVE